MLLRQLRLQVARLLRQRVGERAHVLQMLLLSGFQVCLVQSFQLAMLLLERLLQGAHNFVLFSIEQSDSVFVALLQLFKLFLLLFSHLVKLSLEIFLYPSKSRLFFGELSIEGFNFFTLLLLDVEVLVFHD